MAVVTTEGLVGKVYEVYRSSSSVQIIMDVNSRISARVSGINGIMRWEGGPYLRMYGLPLSMIPKAGADVYTTGFGIYPEGIYIGRVVSPHMDDVERYASVNVEPDVDFSAVQEVFFIRGSACSDVWDDGDGKGEDLFGVRPDMAMIALIFLAGGTGTVSLILYGFLVGFIQDVYTPEYLGYNAFTMSIMGFLLGAIRERLTVENYLVKVFATLFACSIHDLVYLVLYTKFELSLLVSLFIRESLPGVVYTAVLAVLIMKIWEWAKKGGLQVVFRELLGFGR